MNNRRFGTEEDCTQIVLLQRFLIKNNNFNMNF